MTKICPNCKKENQDASNFCEVCGSKLISTKKVQKNKSMGKALTVVFGCCLGLILIITISGMFSSDKNGSSDSNVKTKNYNSDTGVTSGETSDGNQYAYDDNGHMAVSDGKDTYVYDNSTGKVYKYN